MGVVTQSKSKACVNMALMTLFKTLMNKLLSLTGSVCTINFITLLLETKYSQ